MKEITALVVFPVSVSLLVYDTDDEDKIRERILDHASDCLVNSTVKPIIQDCSEENLIE